MSHVVVNAILAAFRVLDKSIKRRRETDPTKPDNGEMGDEFFYH